MITVRLTDGTLVHGFGADSVFARTIAGNFDPFWQAAAEASVAHSDGDLYAGLVALPGARVIRDVQGL